jgi:hypothetical protein
MCRKTPELWSVTYIHTNRQTKWHGFFFSAYAIISFALRARNYTKEKVISYFSVQPGWSIVYFLPQKSDREMGTILRNLSVWYIVIPAAHWAELCTYITYCFPGNVFIPPVLLLRSRCKTREPVECAGYLARLITPPSVILHGNEWDENASGSEWKRD